MPDVATAWAVGLFEGEGCIGIRPEGDRRPNTAVRLSLAMTDQDIVERFAAAVGHGGVRRSRPPHFASHWKTQYVWTTSHRDVVRRLLEEWLPRFGERRAAKAREALAVLDVIDAKRQRVCGWCGESFRAERMTKRFCCEEHRALAKYDERRDDINARRRERHLERSR